MTETVFLALVGVAATLLVLAVAVYLILRVLGKDPSVWMYASLAEGTALFDKLEEVRARRPRR